MKSASLILPVLLLCYSFGSGVAKGKTKKVYACEGSTLSLVCPTGQVLHIEKALYGRYDATVCHEGRASHDWNTQCASVRAPRVVSRVCDDRRECKIPATNSWFGDPCNNMPKYLEVTYICKAIKTLTTPSERYDYISSRDLVSKTASLPVEEETVDKRLLDVVYEFNELNEGVVEVLGDDGGKLDDSTTTKATPTTARRTTKLTTTVTKSPTVKSTTRTSTPTSTATTTRTTLKPTPPPKQFCQEEVKRNVRWPRTGAGGTVFVQCPNNDAAKAARRCFANPARWEEHPDLHLCVSKTVKSIKEMIDKEDHILGHEDEVVQEVEAASKEVSTGGDVTVMADVLQELVHKVHEEAHNITAADQPMAEAVVKKVNKAVVKSSSSLLDERQLENWKDLPQGDQARVATKLVDTVEKSAMDVADTIEEPKVIVSLDVNIMVGVQVVSTNDKQVADVIFPRESDVKTGQWSSGNRIRLSGKTIRSLGVDGLAKLIFLTYNNLEELLRPVKELKKDEKAEEEAAVEDVPLEVPKAEDRWQDVEVLRERPKEPAYEEVRGRDEEVVTNVVKNKDGSSRVVNSQIISASINGYKDGTTLPEPVVYILEHKTKENAFNPTCSFWEYSQKDMTGQWSHQGCKVKATNTTHTECECTHLTNFAVLMDIGGKALHKVHEFSLALITYAGIIVSLVCLAASFFTFCFFKNLQSDRNTIHKNLVACLFIAELIFIVGIFQFHNQLLCGVIAGFLHYFFLASFCWMALEGIQLYVMLIEVFESDVSRIKYYYLAGYGIPAVIVGISAGVDYTGYGTERHCWLETENGFIWSFVAPVIVVLTINVFMLGIAIYKMCLHAHSTAQFNIKEKSKLQQIRSWIKGAIVLVVLLGLTWVFGFFYISDSTVFMAYIFTVLNALQGFFIFLFHCLMNDKVQKEYKKFARRAEWLPMCIRVNYGGASSTSSPNTSTSNNNAFQKLLSGRKRKRSSSSTLQKPLSKGTRQSSSLSTSDNMASPLDAKVPLNSLTEDPEGYLEPVSVRLDPGWDPGAGVDLSLIEGSVADSHYFSEYGVKSPIDVEKYKIKTPPSVPKMNNRLSELDGSDKYWKCGSDYSDIVKLTNTAASDPEYDGDPVQLKKQWLAETESLNSSVQSLNNLDKSSSGNISHNDVRLTAPNIAHRDSLKRTNEEPIYSEVSDVLPPNVVEPRDPRLLPAKNNECAPPLSIVNADEYKDAQALERLKRALNNEDGLVLLYHGKKDSNHSNPRVSQGTEESLQRQNIRLYSSDC